jgi:hypothetical protein
MERWMSFWGGSEIMVFQKNLEIYSGAQNIKILVP